MNNQLSIKVDRAMVTLQNDEILYIKSRHDYMMVVTAGKRYMTYSTTKRMATAVDPACFTRVHRCYIVNLSKVKDIHQNKLVVNDIEIPVSKRYRSIVFERIRKAA